MSETATPPRAEAYEVVKARLLAGSSSASSTGYIPFDLKPREQAMLGGGSAGPAWPAVAAGETPLVVSFGGGDNSRALLCEMVRRQTRPHVILMANTGGERPKTYEQVDLFSEWLVKEGFPPVTWVQKTYQGKPTTLEGDCIRNHTLPSIAYGFKACSQKYKRDPQDKWRNNWPAAQQTWKEGKKVLTLIGYHAGEARRATIREDEKYIYAFPLIAWGWNGEKCKAVIREHGFEPCKSACYFCPSAKKHEILELKRNEPDLAARALRMEVNAHLETVKGLGRNFSWLDLMMADESQIKLFPENSERMPCDCFE